MAQPWSMRYPLILGQGNFGSQDDDPPAAMRYTEAKMAAIADELLRDIEKDTVNFRPNYDNQTEEPTVLPARLPNLLVKQLVPDRKSTRLNSSHTVTSYAVFCL